MPLAVGAAWLGQRRLIYPAPVGEQAMPGGYERVLLETSDGLTLEAAWRAGLPDRPVIVFFHGNGDRLSGAAQAVAPLARAGFSVLLPEYRGYSGNPGSPSRRRACTATAMQPSRGCANVELRRSGSCRSEIRWDRAWRRTWR